MVKHASKTLNFLKPEPLLHYFVENLQWDVGPCPTKKSFFTKRNLKIIKNAGLLAKGI